jgi:hypothetical protein
LKICLKKGIWIHTANFWIATKILISKSGTALTIGKSSIEPGRPQFLRSIAPFDVEEKAMQPKEQKARMALFDIPIA